MKASGGGGVWWTVSSLGSESEGERETKGEREGERRREGKHRRGSWRKAGRRRKGSGERRGREGERGVRCEGQREAKDRERRDRSRNIYEKKGQMRRKKEIERRRSWREGAGCQERRDGGETKTSGQKEGQAIQVFWLGSGGAECRLFDPNPTRQRPQLFSKPGNPSEHYLPQTGSALAGGEVRVGGPNLLLSDWRVPGGGVLAFISVPLG